MSKRQIIIVITNIYALWYGIVEILGLPFQPPGLTWQVPSAWVKSRSSLVLALIWGSLLGPGLVTRNPYAGMWLLLWLVAVYQNLAVAALIGAVHGGARALGVLYNVRLIGKGGSGTDIFKTQLYWRLADGVLLIFITVTLCAYFIK